MLTILSCLLLHKSCLSLCICIFYQYHYKLTLNFSLEMFPYSCLPLTNILLRIHNFEQEQKIQDVVRSCLLPLQTSSKGGDFFSKQCHVIGLLLIKRTSVSLLTSLCQPTSQSSDPSFVKMAASADILSSL